MQRTIEQARHSENNASSILQKWDGRIRDKELFIAKAEENIILLQDRYRSLEVELKNRLYDIQDEIDRKQDLLSDLANLDELKAEFYSQVDDVNRTIRDKEERANIKEIKIRQLSASLDLSQRNLNDSLTSIKERENALTEKHKDLTNIVNIKSREQAQVMYEKLLKEKSKDIKALEEKERQVIKAIDNLRRKYGSFIKIPE
ncbi:hypothetical protein CK910_21535 [Aeromonas sp. CA23]|nr:hypothetical protein CK910_21535 [Aeromonas sp. CA23]